MLIPTDTCAKLEAAAKKIRIGNFFTIGVFPTAYPARGVPKLTKVNPHVHIRHPSPWEKDSPE
jgi:hypothetical protein